MFPSPDPTQLLLGHLPDTTERQFKDARNRLGALVTWLENTGGDVLQPNLDAYLWYLLQDRKLAPATAKAHLYSIRARYKTLQQEGVIREHLQARYREVPDRTEAVLAVAEALRYLEKALDFSLEDLKPKRTPDDYLRLTAEQIFSLLHKPDPHTHSGRRDRAVLALLFTAGLRKTELVRLQVKDLHFWIDDDELALHVPKCRACVERLVPYEDLIWGLEWVDIWLQAAEIDEGYVFRGFYRKRQRQDETRKMRDSLSPNAVERILANYPLEIDGDQVAVNPMDLRRAYARVLYEARLPLDEILYRLGLKDSNTLLNYIGTANDSLRVPAGEPIFAYLAARTALE